MTLYLQGKYFQNENFIQIFSESNMHLYVQTYVIFSHYIWLSGFNLDKTSFQAPSALFLTFKSQIKWSESRSVMSNSLQHHGLAHGILQARILEWVALPFSRGSSQPRDPTQVSHIVGGFFTSWATRKAQELEWVAYPSPEDLPDPGIKPGSSALQADPLPIELSGKLKAISNL